MSESSNSFRDFAARLLDYQGVLVERIEPHDLALTRASTSLSRGAEAWPARAAHWG